MEDDADLPADGGIALKRVNLQSKVSGEMPLSSKELDNLPAAWEDLKQRLSNANVQSVKRSTGFPSIDRASQAPGN